MSDRNGRPRYKIDGLQPKMKCKAVDGDCTMTEESQSRDSDGSKRSTTWRCTRKNCGNVKRNVKF